MWLCQCKNGVLMFRIWSSMKSYEIVLQMLTQISINLKSVCFHTIFWMNCVSIIAFWENSFIRWLRIYSFSILLFVKSYFYLLFYEFCPKCFEFKNWSNNCEHKFHLKTILAYCVKNPFRDMKTKNCWLVCNNDISMYFSKCTKPLRLITVD